MCGQETEWLAPESPATQRDRIGRETVRQIEDLKQMLKDESLLGIGVLNLLLDARVELENAQIQIKALEFQLKLGIASVIDVKTKTAQAN